MDLKAVTCTGSAISGGQIMHEALSCPIHPEVQAFYAGVTEGKRIQFERMLTALGDARGENADIYRFWYEQQPVVPPGYLDRFNRYLARHYLEQSTDPRV